MAAPHCCEFYSARLRLPVVSRRASHTFIHECHQLRASHVAGVQPFDPKSGLLNQLPNWPIQVTATADSLPDGCQSILPRGNAGIRRTAMLNKQQTTVGREVLAESRGVPA